jgi:hypothetical protein
VNIHKYNRLIEAEPSILGNLPCPFFIFHLTSAPKDLIHQNWKENGTFESKLLEIKKDFMVEVAAYLRYGRGVTLGIII